MTPSPEVAFRPCAKIPQSITLQWPTGQAKCRATVQQLCKNETPFCATIYVLGCLRAVYYVKMKGVAGATNKHGHLIQNIQ